MTQEQFIDKACEWLTERLFPTVKVLNEDLVEIIDRWELIDEFHKYMATEEKQVWLKASEELPPIDTEVVCKMKGVPNTEHFVCKWDGKYWWHWNDCGREIKGWFGLKPGWEVVEWKEI